MQKNKKKSKRQMISLILLLAVVFLPLQTGYSAEQENLGQYAKINAEEATLKQYDGTGQTNVIIPGQVMIEDGLYQVTSISNNAFLNQKTIETIRLPKEVKVIHPSAFQGCIALEEIQLPSGLTLLGSSAFQQCNNLRQIDLPETLTILNGKTFSGCSKLQEVILPSQLTTIGSSAFQQCSSLTEICLPAGIDSIASRTFFSCSNLQRVTILHETEQISIAPDAFFVCPQLREIVVMNDAVAAVVADYAANYLKGKEIEIINLSETTEPETPETGGEGETTEPETPETGGEGETTEPETPETGGEGETTEPETPGTGGEGETTEPETPGTGGEGETTEPETPETGGDGEITKPEESEPPVLEDNSTGSGLQWVDWTPTIDSVKSVFKAKQGGNVILDGNTILAVPAQNYAFWQWSDGYGQISRQQDFSGQEIWAEFVPSDAVVTVQQNGREKIIGWCAVREQQLKLRPAVVGDSEQDLHYGWVHPEPYFSDWQQHPYQRALQFAAQRDLLRGVEQGKIAPDAPFTNAMAAAVLHRLMPTEEFVAFDNGDSWYRADWQWAQKRQLLHVDAVPEAVMCGQDFQHCLWQLAAPEDTIQPPRFFAQKPLSRGEAAVLLQDFITQTV